MITDIKFQKMSFSFDEPFHIAFAVISGYDTLVLRIETDEGIVGYGEAAPLEYVTGETLDIVELMGKYYREKLLGENPLAISKIHQIMDQVAGNTSIKAAIDMACYDIAAKKMGVPLWQYLGGAKNQIISDVTLGIDTPERMAQKAVESYNLATKHFRPTEFFVITGAVAGATVALLHNVLKTDVRS